MRQGKICVFCRAALNYHGEPAVTHEFIPISRETSRRLVALLEQYKASNKIRKPVNIMMFDMISAAIDSGVEGPGENLYAIFGLHDQAFGLAFVKGSLVAPGGPPKHMIELFTPMIDYMQALQAGGPRDDKGLETRVNADIDTIQRLYFTPQKQANTSLKGATKK